MLKLIAVFVVCVLKTLAWWDVGHMLVAQIAQIDLQERNPSVYEMANQLVESMGILADDNTFVGSAVWPDTIKDKAMSYLDAWHYVNKPINKDGVYLQQSDYEKMFNATDLLEKAKYELRKSPGKPTFQKAMFIRYALHVVGDIHQPLHSSNFYNETYATVDGDIAGNRETIYTTDGIKTKIHSYWDSGAFFFQSPQGRMEKPLNETNAAKIYDFAQGLMESYPESFFDFETENMNTEDWTQESYRIASDFIYQPFLKHTNQLNKEYEEQSQEICRQRATLAGYRLSQWLIDVFENNESKSGNVKSKQNQIE